MSVSYWQFESFWEILSKRGSPRHFQKKKYSQVHTSYFEMIQMGFFALHVSFLLNCNGSKKESFFFFYDEADDQLLYYFIDISFWLGKLLCIALIMFFSLFKFTTISCVNEYLKIPVCDTNDLFFLLFCWITVGRCSSLVLIGESL